MPQSEYYRGDTSYVRADLRLTYPSALSNSSSVSSNADSFARPFKCAKVSLSTGRHKHLQSKARAIVTPRQDDEHDVRPTAVSISFNQYNSVRGRDSDLYAQIERPHCACSNHLIFKKYGQFLTNSRQIWVVTDQITQFTCAFSPTPATILRMQLPALPWQ